MASVGIVGRKLPNNLNSGKRAMKRMRVRLRTLLVIIVVVAILIEIVGLGNRSRRFAKLASEAAVQEGSSLDAIENSRRAAGQWLAQAEQVAMTNPEEAAKLRQRAELLTRDLPFFEEQAKKAAQARVAYERAFSHPWEAEPAIVTGLGQTPPAGP